MTFAAHSRESGIPPPGPRLRGDERTGHRVLQVCAVERPCPIAPGAKTKLESEIQGNGWLHCAPDSDLIFGTDIGGKHDRALKKIGIDLGMLLSEAAHA